MLCLDVLVLVRAERQRGMLRVYLKHVSPTLHVCCSPRASSAEAEEDRVRKRQERQFLRVCTAPDTPRPPVLVCPGIVFRPP